MGETVYQKVLVPKTVYQTLRGAEPLFQTLFGFQTVSDTLFSPAFIRAFRPWVAGVRGMLQLRVVAAEALQLRVEVHAAPITAQSSSRDQDRPATVG